MTTVSALRAERRSRRQLVMEVRRKPVKIERNIPPSQDRLDMDEANRLMDLASHMSENQLRLETLVQVGVILYELKAKGIVNKKMHDRWNKATWQEK